MHLAFKRLGRKEIAAAWHGADEILLIVGQRPANVMHALRERVLGYDAVIPHRTQQFVF